MGIIETLRVVMRNRIINAGIVEEDRYQREFYTVPDSAIGYYIRETLVDMGRTEPTQTSELQTVLCEYDVIVSKQWLNPTQTADNLVEKLRTEFNVKDTEKINIALADHPNVQAWVREPVTTAAAEVDGEWYRLPVFVYVECLIRWE
jgi:hypothetical protein